MTAMIAKRKSVLKTGKKAGGHTTRNRKPAPKKTNLTPGIVKTSGVCSGDACFIRTRIPVWVVEAYWRLGADDAEILRNYPSLVPSDLNQARIYVINHKKEIDFCIRDNEELN